MTQNWKFKKNDLIQINVIYHHNENDINKDYRLAHFSLRHHYKEVHVES